jgi:hypothetical protein
VRISSRIHASSMLALLALTAGCGGTKEPPLTTATSLTCPAPGALPFRLKSTGFQNKTNQNQAIAAENPRFKDEASQTLGNPGGAIASIYTPDNQMPAPGGIDYQGIKQRTTPTQGLFDNVLPGENVSLWVYDTSGKSWSQLGRTQTDANGVYDLPSTGFVGAVGQPIYAMLEADGSCAVHYDYLYPAGTKFVVFDIDGTLTLSDAELTYEWSDETYVPKTMGAAVALVQAWANKGYTVIYLTARPHDFRADTVGWLDQLQFPRGAVVTENTGDEASAYKTLWLERMITNFGWVAVAAYGNAATDITAYANAGIPTSATFIVGPVGGMGGTVAIPNMDFTDHINTYVMAQPNNQ